MCMFRDLESGLSEGTSARTRNMVNRSVRRAGEFLVEARSNIDAQIVRYTRFLEAKDKSNHLVVDFFLYVFSVKLKLNSSHQVERMVEGIGNMPCSTCSQT